MRKAGRLRSSGHFMKVVIHMFPAMLWQFSKKENSTKRPSDSDATMVDCETNNDFDLLNPVFVFSFRGGSSNPTQYNYCYVDTFKRYYWIAGWTFSNGQWIATCSVDALASWKTEIGRQSAYVLRSAASYDGNIQDTLYPAKTDIVLETSTAESPFDRAGYYVVGTVGDGGITDYASLSYAEFAKFTKTAFSDAFYKGVAAGVDWMAKAAFDPMQYLRSVIYIPLKSSGGQFRSVTLGWWDTGVRGGYVGIGASDKAKFTLDVPKHPQASERGAYLNCAPYASYILDCRPWGRISLDPEDLKGVSSVTFDISVDYITGEGVLTTTIDGGRRVLAVAQVGHQVQLSQVSHDIGGAILSIAGGVGSAITGNAMGVAQGIGNAVNSVMGKVNTIGVNGSVSQILTPPQLSATFIKIVDENNADRGRPLCQVRRIDTLPGYQIHADPEMSLPCTQSEMVAISGYLTGGFLYE